MEEIFEIKQFGDISPDGKAEWSNKTYTHKYPDENNPNNPLRETPPTSIEGITIDDFVHYTLTNRPLLELTDNDLVLDERTRDILYKQEKGIIPLRIIINNQIEQFDFLFVSNTNTSITLKRGNFIIDKKYINTLYKIFAGKKQLKNNGLITLNFSNLQPNSKYCLYLQKEKNNDEFEYFNFIKFDPTNHINILNLILNLEKQNYICVGTFNTDPSGNISNFKNFRNGIEFNIGKKIEIIISEQQQLDNFLEICDYTLENISIFLKPNPSDGVLVYNNNNELLYNGIKSYKLTKPIFLKDNVSIIGVPNETILIRDYNEVSDAYEPSIYKHSGLFKALRRFEISNINGINETGTGVTFLETNDINIYNNIKTEDILWISNEEPNFFFYVLEKTQIGNSFRIYLNKRLQSPGLKNCYVLTKNIYFDGIIIDGRGNVNNLGGNRRGRGIYLYAVANFIFINGSITNCNYDIMDLPIYNGGGVYMIYSHRNKIENISSCVCYSEGGGTYLVSSNHNIIETSLCSSVNGSTSLVKSNYNYIKLYYDRTYSRNSVILTQSKYNNITAIESKRIYLSNDASFNTIESINCDDNITLNINCKNNIITKSIGSKTVTPKNVQCDATSSYYINGIVEHSDNSTQVYFDEVERTDNLD